MAREIPGLLDMLLGLSGGFALFFLYAGDDEQDEADHEAHRAERAGGLEGRLDEGAGEELRRPVHHFGDGHSTVVHLTLGIRLQEGAELFGILVQLSYY